MDRRKASDALKSAKNIIDSGLSHLRSQQNPEASQAFLYDLAHASSAYVIAESFLDYAAKGPEESQIVEIFCADVLRSVAAITFGNEQAWELENSDFEIVRAYVTNHGAPEQYAQASQISGESHLSDEMELVAQTFRRFGRDHITGLAEKVHREDLDVPESIISGLADLGCFGLSIPSEYGGSASGSSLDMHGMVIATEELSRASLSIGGSLITRPEILARAIENGGTEQQKKDLLPRIASGELMSAVAVTEPDFGSDVASINTTARQSDNDVWKLNGVKTWCTFAGRADLLMVLARTNPETSVGHRGLSVFVVRKERVAGHSFDLHQESGGRMQGTAIPTLGYRGMHSFEISFQDWEVPIEALIGGPEGQGRGFYLQMAGFENGRLQTAARAIGVMQRAYEEALQYSSERKVFGEALDSYELTKVKLGRMACLIQACRQYTYVVAEKMAHGEGALEAAMIKAYSCKAAEWVTREAMQIHGGFGYAEEYVVSRLFVDARVLSIFEGADETLCLKLIGRRLLSA
ncbi:MAG: acyl-CoA/acyl-ACP dehydrogenase [Acidimicrobiales bacterium]|nr:acyl-CoA/acyl-ACP dehydrogenase [Acidimicrobiales bacterium]MDG1846550.1 acyl-CoA/acyl-ACP dehydrogenase [Acidimicrobiales bacterium]